jgi:DNA-directed DNA polymerase III PolC
MSDEKPFVHLHVHTQYSLLDGLSPIKKLVKYAAEIGMSHLAITDHGAMYGVIDFYRACKDAGITPIIGLETYVTGWGKRLDERDPESYHLLLLAKDQTGYQNLLRLASEAQLRGYYYRPRVDHDLLQQYSQGLIATSGCLAAEIPRLLGQNREDEAFRRLGWYQDVFGRENFFLELQHHQIPELHVLNKWLVDNQGYAQMPLVATNDVHYVLEGDADAHDTLLCIQTGNVKADQKRLRFSGPTFYLRTAEEMWRLFADVPEALTNTVQIAQMCDVNLDSKGYHLPVFPVPEGHDAESYLRTLAETGLRWRFDAHADDPDIYARLDYELRMIHQMGFDTYFLIVWDLCEFARHADIWWNVRGSGAGSLVAYCLGITNLDPLINGLLFERFLNPGRVSMPDIDMDFPEDRRGEMIEYCARKYGEDKVAAIITFGTMGSKAAIRDVGRALDMPLPEVDRVARLIPGGAKPVKFKDALGDDPETALPELKAAYDKDETARTLIDVARQLEGMTRHASTHAAGIIVADRPLVDYIPLHRPTKGSDEDVPVKTVTQFPMETCESIGLLKIDFLGLSTLTIMRRACDLIARYHDVHYNLSTIPYRHGDDPDTNARIDQMFQMIGRGETIGVFQLESQGMRRMLTDMRPRQFENIVAAVALYRPGPLDYIPMYNKRLHGEEPVEYKHQKLRDIIKETYGIIVFQEQIMQIGAELFGYSLGEADLMRRAVSKKKKEDLLKHRQKFMDRGPEHGVSADAASAIFDDIEFFARYGFNKCVVADTQIVDAETGRRVRVGDLADGTATIEHTLTCDLDRLKIVSGAVTHVSANGVKPVYRLTTQLGRQITATDNHPFYTFDGWRLLRELKIDDQIATLRRVPTANKQRWTEEQIDSLVRALDYDASLPDAVFELAHDQIALLIARMWETRGFVVETKSLLYSTVSQKLQRQVQQMLLCLGILSRRVTAFINSPDLELVLNPPHELIIDDPASVRLFAEQIAPAIVNSVPREKVMNFGGSILQPAALSSAQESVSTGNDIYWDKVVSIEYAGEEMTYDLTVPGTHNFVANDIIVHNSHAADYAMMTCQTAYLKCHYPHEYMAALMSVHRDEAEKVGLFAADCLRMGIEVLPPTVNGSQLDFSIEKQRDGRRSIRFGLGAIKNLGVVPAQHIIEQRKQGGPFRDLDDFCQRVDTRIVNKRALESLIKVGTLDEFAPRPTLLAVLDRILSFSTDTHKSRDTGQISLFGDATGVDFGAQESILAHPPQVEPVSKREMLNWEKELVGLYVTDHPLSDLRNLFANSNVVTTADLNRENEETNLNGRAVMVAGLVQSVRKVTTKKGDMMGIITIEDITGTIIAVLFPRTWGEFQGLIVEDQIVIVQGKVDTSRGDLQIIVDKVSQELGYAELADAAPPPDLNMAFSWMPDEPASDSINGEPDNGDSAPEPVRSAPPRRDPPVRPSAASAALPAEPSHLTTDLEEPGWLAAEEGDLPAPPQFEYHNNTGHITGIAQPEPEPPAARSHKITPPPAPAARPRSPESDSPAEPLEVRRPRRTPPPAPAPEPSGRMLTLTIHRSDDAARDQRRMKMLHDRLIQYPGTDQFRFILRGAGQKTVCMNFSKFPIAISEATLALAEEILGAENVLVEE